MKCFIKSTFNLFRRGQDYACSLLECYGAIPSLSSHHARLNMTSLVVTLRCPRVQRSGSVIFQQPDERCDFYCFLFVRQDCLRTMVVALCDRREYKTLVEYSYDDMLDDVRTRNVEKAFRVPGDFAAKRILLKNETLLSIDYDANTKIYCASHDISFNFLR